jgi:hypothetical protein
VLKQAAWVCWQVVRWVPVVIFLDVQPFRTVSEHRQTQTKYVRNVLLDVPFGFYLGTADFERIG